MNHTVPTMTRARELVAAGYSHRVAADILLRERGVTVSRASVTRWCNPRAPRPAGVQCEMTGRMPSRVVRRMVELRRAGLSNAATARVLNLDEGTGRFDGEVVRYYVRAYGPPGLPFGRGVGRVTNDRSDNFPVAEVLRRG